jgi:TetR/AcrR family transcriptional repressor of nem operon
MYQNGVAATSVDAVLAASGTGKSQLYHYFTDRSDLVVAVIEHQTDVVLAAQPKLFEIESMAGIERWARALVASHTQPGGPFGCPLGTIAAELKNDPAFQPALAVAFAQWQKPLADGLRIMVRSGELGRSDRPGRIAAATIGALQGGMLLARVWRDVEPLRDSVNLALNDIRRRIDRAADKR